MSVWKPGMTLAVLRERCRNTMAEQLGMKITELGPDFLRASMPVDHRTCQPMRLLHGGASVALAETIGSLAANAANKSANHHLVGQEINANHLRPVAEGASVTGVARPIHIGAASHVWGIEITNQDGKLVCIARLTMAVFKSRGPATGPSPI
jgi:1,4-dihydroxy-2-naphthoyl-CoA hydrolase